MVANTPGTRRDPNSPVRIKQLVATLSGSLIQMRPECIEAVDDSLQEVKSLVGRHIAFRQRLQHCFRLVPFEPFRVLRCTTKGQKLAVFCQKRPVLFAGPGDNVEPVTDQ